MDGDLHIVVDVLAELLGHEERLEEGVEVAGGSLVHQTLIAHIISFIPISMLHQVYMIFGWGFRRLSDFFTPFDLPAFPPFFPLTCMSSSLSALTST